MELNSSEPINEAAKVFRNHGGSWTAARAAGQRDRHGVLVIPVNPARDDKGGRFVEVHAHCDGARAQPASELGKRRRQRRSGCQRE